MEERQNYLFGMHPVLEAIADDRKIEKVLFKKGMDGPLFREMLEKLQEKEIPFQFVPIEKLNGITRGKHQGVVAYLPQLDYIELEDMVVRAFKKSETPLLLLLDGVSDVRNFGAIARTAECAGVSGLILPAKGGAAVNADAIKTSAGALLRIPTTKTANLRVALYYLKESGFEIIAATEKADKNIYEVDFKKPTAIIMGAEDKGISESVLALCDEKIKIPMGGVIGSLNVSVAAAIVMFEAVRQRSF